MSALEPQKSISPVDGMIREPTLIVERESPTRSFDWVRHPSRRHPHSIWLIPIGLKHEAIARNDDFGKFSIRLVKTENVADLIAPNPRSHEYERQHQRQNSELPPPPPTEPNDKTEKLEHGFRFFNESESQLIGGDDLLDSSSCCNFFMTRTDGAASTYVGRGFAEQ